MSPLAFYRKDVTPVRINPPFLTYVTQINDPGTISYGGSATFTGISTVNYLIAGIGTLGYEWRINGSVVGVGTQLTLTNMKDTVYNGKNLVQFSIFYPDSTRVGIQTFQPGASNSPLASNTVILKVKGQITITQQPDGDVPVQTSPGGPSGPVPVSPTPRPSPRPAPRPSPTPTPAPTPAPNCNPTNANYNLLNIRDANLNTVYSQNFSLTDVDRSCTGFTVSVDGPTASLVVDGRTGKSLPAQYGSSIQVRMTSASTLDTITYTGFYISKGDIGVATPWYIVTKEYP